MAEVEDVDAIMAKIQGEDMDAEIKIYVIVLIVIEIIIHLISEGTNLINLSGLRLLIYVVHLLQLLPPSLLLLLYRFFSHTISVSFSYDCSGIPAS